MAKLTHPGKWPPTDIAEGTTPRAWLRYERQYPGSRRPSRLISHPTVPYVAAARVGGTDGEIDLAALSAAAEHYLKQLKQYVNATPPPLGKADPMLDLLADVAASGSLLHWCDIWPKIDAEPSRLDGQIASWNMSRHPKSAMPGTVILVATEGIPDPMHGSFLMRFPSAGFRVPVEVRATADGFDLVIRGLTAEFPGGSHQALSSLLAGRSDAEKRMVLGGLSRSLSGVPLGFQAGVAPATLVASSATDADDAPVEAAVSSDDGSSATSPPPSDPAPVPPTPQAGAEPPARSSVYRMITMLEDNIAKQAGVVPKSLLLQDIRFSAEPENVTDGAWDITLTLLARGQDTPRGEPVSYRLTVRVRLAEPGANEVELLSVTRVPLVSHAVAGTGVPLPPPLPFVRVFPVPPPDWRAPSGRVPPHPAPPLAWRRPTRPDRILDLFREDRAIPLALGMKMQQPAYEVRNCPRFVPGDGEGRFPKALPTTGLSDLPPRRNVSSAISAYWHSKTFFDNMRGLGLAPESYMATAEGPLAVHYRSGIVPGPGRDGRTINAQVRYEVAPDATLQSKPSIDMHLALANLNRWARVKTGTPDSRLEPLGIASCGRWMLHEFGHYLLAARIGQLEFDFAHSAGDSLAAVFFDPLSDLSSPTYPGDPRMRGWTFPFVFAPRRHDRTPAMGWGWYGLLNRSVIEDPPDSGSEHKAYLTEQILSSTCFLLYRSLGGDTLAGAEADWTQRTRASDMTLYLLMQGMAGLAQSPSRAEMLEVGMEEAGWSASASVPLPRGGADWQPATSHKVTRWAYETMGMFPSDPSEIISKAGAAPLVDIYIRDRRPNVFPTGDGPVEVGPGSYVPVSLLWAADAAWVMPGWWPSCGNRGSVAANGARLRAWAGWVLSDKPLAQIMERSVVWHGDLDIGPFDIAPGGADMALAQTDQQQITQLTTAARNAAPAGTQLVAFYELSQINDRANTDPSAGFTVMIGPGASPPTTVQALVDLVAGDNNLGLHMEG
ncbi:hypothetical protein K4K95_08155 [Phaeobacter inhibens]|uniref:hypothetical protein n=1 Tax=Phaeobacter inhibens TaxID=221822 RepID=UPI0021A574A4|nr:hypothetical protein [Phaeobacter inhibens]UWR70139.1 hypothetical protein K4K95_08155 [Phaeobacter inhibens]